MTQALGNRMKSYYEEPFKYRLPRRTYTIVRVDGSCFHTFVKSIPDIKDYVYSQQMMDSMDLTAEAMCRQIHGCRFAYVQSDEISFLVTDFETIQTEPWFGGVVQKQASIAAAMATTYFNASCPSTKLAFFDARVFVIPSKCEVYNYFVWRQQDCLRNAIQMAARHYFSHKECLNLNGNQLQEKLFQEKGINFNDYSVDFKRGRLFRHEVDTSRIVGYTEEIPVYRSVWRKVEIPIFTQEPSFIQDMIPEQS